jgi:hypothetical protein
MVTRDGYFVVTQSDFHGLGFGDAVEWGPGGPGGPGLNAQRSSELYLAQVNLTGGEGGDAFFGGTYCNEYWPAHRGGHGLELIEDSTCLIATREAAPSLYTGGLGGSGLTSGEGCGGPSFEGGDGGDALNVEQGSMALVSGPLALDPGEGGPGDPPGNPGQERSGLVLDVDPSRAIPVLTLEGTGEIGTDMTLHLTGRAGERVIFILSDRFAKTSLPNADGFPLFASPGGHLFLVVPAGSLDANGDLVLSATIPDSQDLIGLAVLSQAILYDPASPGPAALSNPTLEVVRDH